MHGAGDHLSIGQRVAFYRVRRGLTQAVLGDLVGKTEDWVSKIERGDRPMDRISVMVDVARALRVNLGDLLGEPVLLEDDDQNDDVPAIRDALMAPHRLSRVLFVGPSPHELPDVQRTADLAEAVWAQYQAGRVGRSVAALPDLIRAAQALEAGEGAERAGAWATSARIHHLAGTTLSKIGEADLAWIAAERAMGAADRADDLLVLASAARAGTHALLAIGRYDDALQLGATATSWLTSRIALSDPAALSLLGMLNLRMAVAAARRQDRGVRNDLLRKARSAAEQLGEDANHWQTAFGPTNVLLHDLSTALDLGDVSYVIAHGADVTAENLPAERRISHQIDLARAYSFVAQDSEAVDALLRAERDAPQLVHHSPLVRETVRDIQRRSPVTSGRRGSDFARLAERCRAVA
ncbi:MAG: helix-turn-helix domain-containing protein [Pseudonocardiaceae bacterium]|nr:helix-turn-helix domain-containing protein [Pseudonocardiaceae bacterium]